MKKAMYYIVDHWLGGSLGQDVWERNSKIIHTGQGVILTE